MSCSSTMLLRIYFFIMYIIENSLSQFHKSFYHINIHNENNLIDYNGHQFNMIKPQTKYGTLFTHMEENYIQLSDIP